MIRERLRSILAVSGFTIADVARKVGIERSALSRILDGQQKLDVEVLGRIGEVLGFEVKLVRLPPESAGMKNGQGYRYLNNEDLEYIWSGLSDREKSYLTEIERVRREFMEGSDDAGAPAASSGHSLAE
jgi:transcriptional regulator with XRE-family HTH domain